MGLFKKRASDPAEMERLRAELMTMSARLDAADAAKVELGSHVEQLAARVDETAAANGTSPPVDPAIDEIRVRLDQLDGRVERERPAAAIDGGEFEALLARVDEIGARFDAPLTTPPPPPETPAAPATGSDDATLIELHRRLDALDARLGDLDTRITSISTELAHQITEISDDFEHLGGDAPAEQVVDELRDAQTRLASEQARYQIAFRQDLAELADRLKRS